MRFTIFGALVLIAACTDPPPMARTSAAAAAFQDAVDLNIVSGDATLAATLRLPSNGRAPFPAIVLAHGSGLITRDHVRSMADRFLAMGLAVLSYDKRGVGRSTGTYVNVGTERSVEVFDVLAGDALAGLAAIKARPEIDGRRIGLGGASQAGWIIPLAASRSPDVRFLVILSGPAVTVGEEIAYSRLAGADPGSIQGLSDAEIDRRMNLFKGPHGYDPVPVLERLETPSLWIEGENDRSVPMAKTLSTLDRLRAGGRPIAVVKLPGADHSLRNTTTGGPAIFWPAVQGWLVSSGVLPPD